MSVFFLLNDESVVCNLPSGTILLDYLRYFHQATGTKIGCREGDCGACTVLIGTLEQGQLIYRSMTSCLVPIGNVSGKHVVTIEGLNMQELSPIQKAVIAEGATQCGFCTPGFVVSLTGYCFHPNPPSTSGALAAMSGNICRCTGYKSLERAADALVQGLRHREQNEPVSWLVARGYLPAWFLEIPNRLKALPQGTAAPPSAPCVGGGTDLYVQRPESLENQDLTLFLDRPDLRGIQEKDGQVLIGGAVTAEELHLSPIMNRILPKMPQYLKLISSAQIRNMGTLAGNLVNASPIGDLSVFFLALGAELHLSAPNGEARCLPLKNFFHSYKKLDLAPGEIIRALSFPLPSPSSHFHFEKVSKRTHLDIASVNSAILIQTEGNLIQQAALSAGGVFEIPLFLSATAAFLEGKPLSVEVVREAAAVAAGEIRPISDIRGTKEYKSLLLRQLIYAHFLSLYPEQFSLEALV